MPCHPRPVARLLLARRPHPRPVAAGRQSAPVSRLLRHDPLGRAHPGRSPPPNRRLSPRRGQNLPGSVPHEPDGGPLQAQVGCPSQRNLRRQYDLPGGRPPARWKAECQRSLSSDFNVNYTAGRLLNVFDVEFQGDVKRPNYSNCPAGSVPIKSGSSDDFARCVYCLVGTFFNVVNEVRQSCSQGSWWVWLLVSPVRPDSISRSATRNSASDVRDGRLTRTEAGPPIGSSVLLMETGRKTNCPSRKRRKSLNR